jgi:hypothetical protein
MSRRFSRAYSTFEEWSRAQTTRSPYSARIERTHARYPTATLGQLRRHPGTGRSPLSKVPRALPSRVPLAYLTPKERLARRRALEVVSDARRGKGSLSKLARARGISPKTIRRASGAFRKRGGRWVPTGADRVERWLKSYEKGQRIEVLINDSRTASRLSQYSNAVGRFTQTADPSGLAEFEGETYIDAFGKVHSFETDPDAIRAAIERAEDDLGAFAELYADPEEVEPEE